MACSFYGVEPNNLINISQCKETDISSSCFAIWQINSQKINDKYVLINKGCWGNDTDLCISKYLATNIFFYCCQGNYCNDNLNPEFCIKTIHQLNFLKKIKNTLFQLIPEISLYILIILTSLALLFTIILALIYIKLMIKKKKSKILNYITFLFYSKKKKKWIKKKKSLEKNCDLIYLEKKADKGSFGDIFKGKLLSQKVNILGIVAIKIFKLQDEASFKKEFEIFQLPNFKHENIVTFVKAEVHRNEFWLLTKFEEKGSLLNFLKSNMINWNELIQICLDISNGLHFLHNYNESKSKIAHRDIKPANILLNENLKACISDFGLAYVDEAGKNKLTCIKQDGTIRYMSPELLDRVIECSIDALLKSDIYSLALVFWEILNRYNNLNDPSKRQYLMCFQKELGKRCKKEALYDFICLKKSRPKIEECWLTNNQIKDFSLIIEECWDHNPMLRLNTKNICERLEKIKTSDLKELTS